MTTPRVRAIVSLSAILAMTVALAGCASATSRATSGEASMAEAGPLGIRFDNDAREAVRVYLIGERREWLLARMEPGAVAWLRIPDAALGDGTERVQLAVVAGEGVTLRAARDVRARLSIVQPASALLSQRWHFAQGQITSLGVRRAAAGERGT